MIVFGGFSQGSRMNDVLVYSFADIMWQTLKVEGKRPCERSGHAAVIYEGSMYIFGGKDDENSKLNDLWKFDLTTKTWL